MARKSKVSGRVHESGLVNRNARDKRSGIVGGKSVPGSFSSTKGRVTESGLVGGGRISESSLANPSRKGILRI